MDTDKNTVENFNETKLKKAIINFERRLNENQKLRIKHAESPTKFASSETELFACLDELQSVSTQPELYHVLISKKALPLLMSLLLHENTDISAKIIGMLQDFTDIDETEEQKSTETLIQALLDENVIEIVASNLSRLDGSIKEESQAINNSLAIIDNLIDYDSKLATRGSEALMKWMIKQLKKSLEFNSIKLSISELLSVLLMNGGENKTLLGELGGIDVLLQQVAYYRRIAPVTGDEHEFLEQTINCLCTALLDCEANRELFYKEEGVDLIELILREKREAVKKSNIKVSTLKLFNHVLTTEKNQDSTVTQCCERFVQVLGLRVIFPILNNPKIILSEKVKKREYHQVLDEIEEHSSAIILALLKYCQDSELIQRVLVKFAECNFEKLNRIIDMHEKYLRLVSNQEQDNGSERDEDEDDEAKDMASKSSAYFTLRAIDYIILLTCYLSNHFETYEPNSGEKFTNRIGKILSRRPEFKHQIIFEVRKHVDEVESSEEKNSLRLLLDYFEQLSASSIGSSGGGGKDINKEPQDR